MWAEVILNTEQTFFDGKFVKKCNTFSKLFLSMDPHCSAFFFFFVSSPLSHLSSLLCALPHVSKLTQLSPQKYWTHPPLITLTRPAITPFSVLECSEVTHLSLLSTDHPPLITLNRSPTSHNSHQTNNFLLCTFIWNPPNPNIQKKSHAPPQ